ncbi:MAG: hypothetical protein K2W95_29375 [Candidatus Obscuribacterales bacterium]|nr:hypothetical protein [Candidatus Obscuribacterales bacterium]
MRASLILALGSTAVLLTCADGRLSAQNDASMIRHRLNIGKAVSVELPSTWLPEPSKTDLCQFTKRRGGWNDCMITFGIRAPVTFSKLQTEKFHHAIAHAKSLTEKQALALANPFELSHTGYNRSSVVTINGKQSLQLSFRSTGPGPCQPSANGEHRRPMLNSASMVLIVPMTDSQWQAIYFQTNTMGEVDKCLNEFPEAVGSIIWK